jgi:hypothetical protein
MSKKKQNPLLKVNAVLEFVGGDTKIRLLTISEPRAKLRAKRLQARGLDARVEHFSVADAKVIPSKYSGLHVKIDKVTVVLGRDEEPIV